MNYQTLYTELSRHTGSDGGIAAALNLETVVKKLAKTDDIIALAYNIGLYPQLVAIGLNDQYPIELRAMAKSLIDLNLGTIPEIDPFAPASVAMLDGLQAANLITQDQRGQFEALGIASKTSRASQLGLGTVTEADIQAARAWAEAQQQREAMLARLDSAYNQTRWMVANDAPLPEWAAIVAVFEAV